MRHTYLGEWESKDMAKMANKLNIYFQECAVLMHNEQAFLSGKMSQMVHMCV